jgi:hypothetical protein
VFSLSTLVDQKDIQIIQNDFCKFLMREVLYEGGCFYDNTSDYATNPKFEALRASTEIPVISLLS